MKNHPNFCGIKAYSTDDFLREINLLKEDWDCYISAAALGDIQFNYGEGKLKKGSFPEAIKIKSAPDVLKNIIETKKPYQKVIGFAAETDLTDEVLREKLLRKPVDLLVGTQVYAEDSNSVSQGFGVNEANYKIIDSSFNLVHQGL